jgi:hypothetical protein
MEAVEPVEAAEPTRDDAEAPTGTATGAPTDVPLAAPEGLEGLTIGPS